MNLLFLICKNEDITLHGSKVLKGPNQEINKINKFY